MHDTVLVLTPHYAAVYMKICWQTSLAQLRIQCLECDARNAKSNVKSGVRKEVAAGRQISLLNLPPQFMQRSCC